HSRQLAAVRAKVQASERDRRLAELTVKELSALDDGVRTYKPCGKIGETDSVPRSGRGVDGLPPILGRTSFFRTRGRFIQHDKSALQKELQARAEADASEIKALAKTQEYLDRNIKDSQNSLKEILERR
ncbi:MAG: hypothetical protein BJ554DRAFT_2713, partial [Olpidium bornovanus]